MSQFKYTPLEDSDDICVIQLLSGQPNQEIVCRLHVLPGKPSPAKAIVDPPKRRSTQNIRCAILYLGFCKSQYPIELDSETFYVRRNLFSFLWHARPTTGSCFYGFDAL